MNRPTHKPEDLAGRRKSAKRTALIVMGVAIAVYVGFLLLMWLKH